jgi:hypothetical protein
MTHPVHEPFVAAFPEPYGDVDCRLDDSFWSGDFEKVTDGVWVVGDCCGVRNVVVWEFDQNELERLESEYPEMFEACSKVLDDDSENEEWRFSELVDDEIASELDKVIIIGEGAATEMDCELEVGTIVGVVLSVLVSDILCMSSKPATFHVPLPRHISDVGQDSEAWMTSTILTYVDTKGPGFRHCTPLRSSYYKC